MSDNSPWVKERRPVGLAKRRSVHRRAARKRVSCRLARLHRLGLLLQPARREQLLRTCLHFGPYGRIQLRRELQARRRRPRQAVPAPLRPVRAAQQLPQHAGPFVHRRRRRPGRHARTASATRAADYPPRQPPILVGNNL
ncbi:hypothetical protein [Streptomyces hypolithicus]